MISAGIPSTLLLGHEDNDVQLSGFFCRGFPVADVRRGATVGFA